MGTHIHMGKRDIKNRDMASPIEGTRQSYKNQYYRQAYNLLYQPYSERLLCFLSHETLKHQKIYDFLMNNVLSGGMEETSMRIAEQK